MARPHAASIVEDAWHRQVDSVLRSRGWQTRIVAHTGYGSEEFARVLGRVLLTRRAERGERADAGASTAELRSAEDERRGWRAFITAPAMNVPVTITVGDKTVHTRTDRSGYIDIKVRDHRLAPGWHEATLTSVDAEDITAAVLVVGADETFGLISDIDDTVISTSLPRPMIAAWNTFVKSENARHVVPGMATMYRELLAEHPNAPMVYVSTGAWNTAPTLTRFLRRHGYPPGPLLLTDWGPTNTGWFRSGQDHKRACLHRLANEFPQHPLGARRRRRPARPQDLRRLRRAAPRHRCGHRDPRADAERAGAVARHTGVAGGVHPGPRAAREGSAGMPRRRRLRPGAPRCAWPSARTPPPKPDRASGPSSRRWVQVRHPRRTGCVRAGAGPRRSAPPRPTSRPVQISIASR